MEHLLEEYQERQLQELREENARIREIVAAIKRDEYRMKGSWLDTLLETRGKQAAEEDVVKYLKDKTLDEIVEMSLEWSEDVKELLAKTVVEMILPDLRE